MQFDDRKEEGMKWRAYALKGWEKLKSRMQRRWKLPLLLLLPAVMYMAGYGVAGLQRYFVNGRNPAQSTAGSRLLLGESANWGLGFGAEGTQPTGMASPEELAEYNAYYIGTSSESKLYLTFDCGYENGNTEAILDALKKHNAQGTFFVVGHYLETAPEVVKRMVEEGHIVGNHTWHHPDMSAIREKVKFQEEMERVAVLYEEITGQTMAPIYRPPQGKYSLENLRMARDLGYHTFFWSLAYVDWNVDQQPSHEEAFKKLCSRVHPGGIVLLHNTSRTNGEILDELLTRWEEMGYTFGSLEEFYR